MATGMRNLPSANGKHLTTNGKKIASLKKRVLRSPTRNYQSHGENNWWGLATSSLDGRPVFTWLDIPRMFTDPKVIFISRLWRAPFQKVEFTVRGSNARVASFVQNTIKRFWRGSLPKLMSRYFKHGYCAGGVEFAPHEEWIRLAEVKAMECRDVRPRVWASDDPEGRFFRGQFAGFTLRHAGMDRDHTTFVGPPFAFWFAGQSEYGAFFDRPPLAGLFEPWLEKNGRGGAVHSRRTWYRRNASRGSRVRYPPGVSNCGTDENPQFRDNQDIAREMAETAETNATWCLENTTNPATNEYEWVVEDPQGFSDIAGFLEYPDKLDEKMVEGAGIPLEVIQGSDSGSGYKGRLVSYGGHLGTVDELTGLVLKACEPFLTPLVRLNYGSHAWYDIEPVSLAKIASEEEKRQPTNPVGQPLASLPGGNGPGPRGGGGGAGELPFQLSDLGDDSDSPVCYRFGMDDPEPVLQIRASAVDVISLSTTDYAPDEDVLTHKFGCAYIPLPPTMADQIRQLAARIPDAVLADDGREDEPHITVRYGLHTTRAEDVEKAVEGSEPVRIALGAVSIFPGRESGKDYDVIKVEVHSPGLHTLHRELATLPHTDTHPDYCPHVAVAYVKPGWGRTLTAMAPRFHAEFTAHEMIYSTAAGEKATISLRACDAPHELAATITPSDMDQGAKAAAFNTTASRLMRTRKTTIAQLLALAMVRKQQAATAAGKPEAAAGSLEALGNLASDPVQVARIVGMKELSALFEVELAWTSFTTARGTTGAVSDTAKDALGRPKKLYGKKALAALAAGERRLTREEGAQKARDIINKFVQGKGDLDDLPELATNLQHLTLQELNEYRKALEVKAGIGFNMRGEKSKERRIQRLIDHIDHQLGGAGETKAPTSAPAKATPKPSAKKSAPAPAPEPAPAPVAKTAVAPATVTPDGSVVPATAPAPPVPTKKVTQPDAGEVPDKLPGGKADAVPESALPPEALAEGAAHEQEHTDDPATAKEIARDHLVEDPQYYDKLKKIEQPAPKTPADRIAAMRAKQAAKAPDQSPAPSPTEKPGTVQEEAQKAVAFLRSTVNDKTTTAEDRQKAFNAAREYAAKLPRKEQKEYIQAVREALTATPEDESTYEGAQPGEGPVAPTPPPTPPDEEPEVAPEPEKTNLRIKADKAMRDMEEAVTKKRSAKTIELATKRAREFVAELPIEEQREFPLALQSDAAKRAPVLNAEDQALLAKLRAPKAPAKTPAPPPTAAKEKQAEKVVAAEIKEPAPAPAPATDTATATPDAAPVPKAKKAPAKQPKEESPPLEPKTFAPGEIPEPERFEEWLRQVAANPDLLWAEPNDYQKHTGIKKLWRVDPDKLDRVDRKKFSKAILKVYGRSNPDILLQAQRANPLRMLEATMGVAPLPVPDAKKAGGKKAAAKKSGPVDTIKSMAEAETDPVAKDYLESALHNAKPNDPADLAAWLGTSIEETVVAAKDNAPTARTVPPVARDAVIGALKKLGAKESGKPVGAVDQYDPTNHQPIPTGTWFPGDPVEVVRPPLVMNGKVVSKGLVKPVSQNKE